MGLGGRGDGRSWAVDSEQRGGVGELREDKAKLMVGSAWAEESCTGWSTVTFELAGARVGRLRCSGGSGLGSGEGVRGMRCGGALGAEAHASWGSGALRCASHGDGEVMAAELGWGGVAREGGSSTRGGGSKGSRGAT